MKTILLTGFEPFDGETTNPSWELVRALDGKRIGKHSQIVGAKLSCVFGQALEELAKYIHAHQPTIVVCIGQASGRSEISIERVAINIDDARIADNQGSQPIDRAIVPEGPAAYFSSLPIKAIVASINAQGVPAAVSQSAGTFVCNHVFYGLMHMAAKQPAIRHAGFVHIPYLPTQAVHHAGAPSMSLEMMTRAILQLLETTLTTKGDAAITGGSLH